MKMRYLTISLLLAAAIGSAAPAEAASNEHIANLAISASLSSHDVLDVSEQLDYDFGGNVPHSIVHDIPLSYQDDQGIEYPVTLRLISGGSRSDNGTVSRITIPAGSGGSIRRYVLHYTVTPVVLNGPTADVLRFSATDLGWPAPIAHASLTLNTPKPAINLTCLTGTGSSTSSNCQITQVGRTATVVTDAVLAATDTLTIYCNFPRGSFTSYLEQVEQGLPWFVMVIGVLVLLIAIIVGSIWLARRRSRVTKAE